MEICTEREGQWAQRNQSNAARREAINVLPTLPHCPSSEVVLYCTVNTRGTGDWKSRDQDQGKETEKERERVKKKKKALEKKWGRSEMKMAVSR